MLHSATRIDSRQNRRFPISALIWFQWREQGRVRDESGMTRNVSIRGISVSSSECPPPASTVTFTLQLPNFGRQLSGLTIQAQGRVTRLEYSDDSNTPIGFSFSGGPWGIFDSEELGDASQ
jgi:hypothetical protein